MNPKKQASVTVNGMNIVNADVLRKSGDDAVLLITAIAHKDAIKSNLKAYGFSGEVFDLI